MEQGRKTRRHISGPEKVAILRRHLVEKVPVSALCDELHLQPTALYRWLKEFFDNGAAAFASKAGPGRIREEQRRIQALEQKLRRKDEVLGELMEEHIALKKRLGEP